MGKKVKSKSLQAMEIILAVESGGGWVLNSPIYKDHKKDEWFCILIPVEHHWEQKENFN